MKKEKAESLNIQKMKFEIKNIADVMYILCLERLHSGLENQRVQNFFEVFESITYFILQIKVTSNNIIFLESNLRFAHPCIESKEHIRYIHRHYCQIPV